MNTVTLSRLTEDDREQFILDNQYAFKYGAMEEFGERDDHFEEDGEIISRRTIEESIDGGRAYRILENGRRVGGLVLRVDEKTQHNELELLFVDPKEHNKGIGQAAWKEVERLYPETRVWETCTPYFETRNINFYVNICGFHIVEFYNSHHPEPEDLEFGEEDHDEDDEGGMFRFEKRMDPQTGAEGSGKTKNRLKYLGLFVFILSPLLTWSSVIATDETAVFASLSRMIWYSGDALRIFVAMVVMFLPMIISFFSAHTLIGLPKEQKIFCRVLMIISCAVLYTGAMEVTPSDGNIMTTENVWHGILSFSGMFMIYLTYCIYTAFIRKRDKDGAGLLTAFLIFTLISGAFAVLNIFDDKSYVVASAVSELYVLTMLSLIGYMTYYLSYRREKEGENDMDMRCPGTM
ncbi:MAG: GNAT family N-acetyltransferase [Eubacteriaceae bacterium]|nr:GNAT family N-acetyltransferase [Eubacteriaceae bacterium]